MMKLDLMDRIGLMINLTSVDLTPSLGEEQVPFEKKEGCVPEGGGGHRRATGVLDL